MTERNIQGKGRESWKDHIQLFCTILIQAGSGGQVVCVTVMKMLPGLLRVLGLIRHSGYFSVYSKSKLATSPFTRQTHRPSSPPAGISGATLLNLVTMISMPPVLTDKFPSPLISTHAAHQ